MIVNKRIFTTTSTTFPPPKLLGSKAVGKLICASFEGENFTDDPFIDSELDRRSEASKCSLVNTTSFSFATFLLRMESDITVTAVNAVPTLLSIWRNKYKDRKVCNIPRCTCTKSSHDNGH